jgi:hypothetical protein
VRPGPHGSEIPLEFLIPYDNRASCDEDSRSTINWRVEVEGEFQGVDYSTQFEVPVFKTDASSLDVREPVPAAETLDHALLGGGPLEGSKVQVTALPADGVALYFPPARNKGGAISVTVFAAIWGGVTWFLTQHADAPVMMTGIFWFFEVLMVCGALSMWFSSMRVRAGQRGLVVKGGLFGLGREKTLTMSEIDYVKIDVSSQQNSNVSYRLRAHRGRQSTGCGSAIPDKAEAVALAALLNRALGIDPPGARDD